MAQFVNDEWSQSILDELEHIENEYTCSICLEYLSTHPSRVLQLPCQHRFHIGCLGRWWALHSTCPLCRQDIPSNTLPPCCQCQQECTGILLPTHSQPDFHSEEVETLSLLVQDPHGGAYSSCLLKWWIIYREESWCPGCFYDLHTVNQLPW